MDKEQFAIFTAEIQGLYPRENLFPNPVAMSAWYELLQDLEYELARAALHRHASTSPFPPTVADIRRQAVSMVDESEDWGKAWQAVIKAVGRYGSYREAEALESMDELTRQTIQRLGWKQICQSEQTELAAIRANFRMIYEQIQTAAREEAQLSDKLKSAIERITGAEVKRIGV